MEPVSEICEEEVGSFSTGVAFVSGILLMSKSKIEKLAIVVSLKIVSYSFHNWIDKVLKYMFVWINLCTLIHSLIRRELFLNMITQEDTLSILKCTVQRTDCIHYHLSREVLSGSSIGETSNFPFLLNVAPSCWLLRWKAEVQHSRCWGGR